MKYFQMEILFCWHKWNSGCPFYDPNYQQSHRTTRDAGRQFSFLCGRSQVRMPALRPAINSLPLVIIFMPSGQIVGHVLFFPHPLQFIKGLAAWRIGVKPTPIHVWFVVDKITLRLIFLWVFRFLLVSIIPSGILAHSSSYDRRCGVIAVGVSATLNSNPVCYSPVCLEC